MFHGRTTKGKQKWNHSVTKAASCRTLAVGLGSQWWYIYRDGKYKTYGCVLHWVTKKRVREMQTFAWFWHLAARRASAWSSPVNFSLYRAGLLSGGVPGSGWHLSAADTSKTECVAHVCARNVRIAQGGTRDKETQLCAQLSVLSLYSLLYSLN